MKIVIDGGQAKRLTEGYDRMMAWIGDHAELCQCSPAEKRRLDRAANKAGKVVDEIQQQVKNQREVAL